MIVNNLYVAYLILGSLDGIGIHGQVLMYSMIFALTASALLAVIYFWTKGLLTFSEEASVHMIRQDDTKVPEEKDE